MLQALLVQTSCASTVQKRLTHFTSQINKMSMICDKLMLQEGETFLDIGCGWGSLCRVAAHKYGAKATGVTLSKEGKKYCDIASQDTGVPTEILRCDYRDIPKGKKVCAFPRVCYVASILGLVMSCMDKSGGGEVL